MPDRTRVVIDVDELPRCRFDDGSAMGRFAMNRGCVCFPDDREQDLCAQHAHQSEPLGSMDLIVSYVGGCP